MLMRAVGHGVPLSTSKGPTPHIANNDPGIEKLGLASG